MLIQPLSATQTKLILLCNVDPKFTSLPAWLLNAVTKQMAPHMFEVRLIITAIRTCDAIALITCWVDVAKAMQEHPWEHL
jgi:hypothetical protein